MSYEIKFSNQATKFFRNLPLNIQERIKLKFKLIADNPNHFLEHYEGDYHKIRIGNLRALVDIDNKQNRLFIRVFDKRSKIYK